MVIVGGSGYFMGPFVGALISGAAAGMDAHHRGLLSDPLRGAGHGDDAAFCRLWHHRNRSNARHKPLRRKHKAAEPVLRRRNSKKRNQEEIAHDGRPRRSPICSKVVRRHHRGQRRVASSARDGEILGIIGPNGSGKSTLFNCVLGQLQPSEGEVRVDGKLTTGMRPCDINRLGVSRTFQLLQVFPQLSVRDNLILAGQEHQGSMFTRLIGRADAGLGAGGRPDDRILPACRISPTRRPAC